MTQKRVGHLVSGRADCYLPARMGAGSDRKLGAARVLWLGIFLLLLTWSGSAQAGPVIPAGKEGVIMDLFAPHELGGSFGRDCQLRRVEIRPDHIVVTVLRGEDQGATMTLRPSSPIPSDATTPSFSLTYESPNSGLSACLSALRDIVAKNDDGDFWEEHTVRPLARSTDHPDPPAPGHEGEESLRVRGDARWLTDPVLRFGILAVVWLTLLLVNIRREGWWLFSALASISLFAALLRVWLSPEINMAPWAYSRVITPVKLLMESDLFSQMVPGGVRTVELINGTVWIYALLTPVAIFLHARYLLADPKRAIAAAVLVALLPLHVRFSHSDSAFIPSIATSALVFALIHTSTREKRAWARLLALAALPLTMLMMFDIRPLNIMYMPLMLATCWIRGWDELDKRWVLLSALVVSAATFGIGVPKLLESYGREVSDGLSVGVLISSLGVLFSWRYNILINPILMPTGILALAVYGTVVLWRSEERRVGVFLLVWLAMFLVAHAYIVPDEPAMQARYHLHLVTPFVMLAACGLAALPVGRLRLFVWVYLLACPLIHFKPITDTGFNDMREYDFVRRTAAQMADGCAVIEYTGEFRAESRYRRMSERVIDGERPTRLISLATSDTDKAEGELVSEVVLEAMREPPECTYLYIGLACEGTAQPDELMQPSCEFLLESLPLELLEQEKHPVRSYDANYRLGYIEGTPSEMTLSLYRVLPAQR